MKRYVVIDKEVGQTPLQALEALRAREAWIGQERLAYAGRLDPMASGTLLVLVGEECKRQDRYNGLDKEYIFEVVLGISSDTGDVLGLSTLDEAQNIHDEKLRGVARSLVGRRSFPFPSFSSKTVNGKQLHHWAVEGRIDEIQIPTKESTIYRLDYEGSRTMGVRALADHIHHKIDLIPPVTEPSKAHGRDFRRVEIHARWCEVLDGLPDNTVFQIARFRCIASSGTYMRTLAGEIGKKLGTRGLAFSIDRTIIGRYCTVAGRWGLWTRQYR